MSKLPGRSHREIYRYQAPWPLYAMGWSQKPVGTPEAESFRLALGSFIEEYSNKVQVVALDPERFIFKMIVLFLCSILVENLLQQLQSTIHIHVQN